MKTKSVNNEKPFLFQRVGAFLFDMIIISFLSSLLASPFIDSNKIQDLDSHYTEVIQDFVAEKISFNEYTAEIVNVQYELVRTNGLVNITGICLSLLYFIVLPLYYNGQTFGKRIMKIKIVSTSGDLNANQLIFRSFLANSILLDLLSIIFVMLASRSTYFYCVGLLSFTQYCMMVASFFMIIIGKEGLSIHDYLVHTKVIKV